MKISGKFPMYKEYNPLVPVWCVTPNVGRCIHRFFDTSPFSPSMRYMAVLRMYKTDKPQPWQMIGEQLDFLVVTMKPDGSDICTAVPLEHWRNGGHHINWHPNGKQLTMNLAIEEEHERMYFVRVDYNGENLTKMHESLRGSGHPTLHPNGRHILTDSYEHEPVAVGDGTVPLRFIDINTGAEKTIVRVNVKNAANATYADLRVDPHPAWAPDNRHIAFNGYVGGTRRVFVADLGGLLKGRE